LKRWAAKRGVAPLVAAACCTHPVPPHTTSHPTQVLARVHEAGISTDGLHDRLCLARARRLLQEGS
jgi:hypothetical protein